MNSDVEWIILKTGEILKLDSRELLGLRKHLWQNYLRDAAAIEAFVSSAPENVLHPVLCEALRSAVIARRDLLEVQYQDDKPERVVVPHFFNHGPVYVHRLWVPPDLNSGGAGDTAAVIPSPESALVSRHSSSSGDRASVAYSEFGIVIQTIAVDISDQAPFALFMEVVSCQMQIPLSQLRLFTHLAPPMTEEYMPGENPPVAERMQWSQNLNEMKAKMYMLPSQQGKNSQQVTLQEMRIGPGSEIFAVSMASIDIDKLCIEGIKRLWCGDPKFTQLAHRIPLPRELHNEASQHKHHKKGHP